MNTRDRKLFSVHLPRKLIHIALILYRSYTTKCEKWSVINPNALDIEATKWLLLYAKVLTHVYLVVFFSSKATYFLYTHIYHYRLVNRHTCPCKKWREWDDIFLRNYIMGCVIGEWHRLYYISVDPGYREAKCNINLAALTVSDIFSACTPGNRWCSGAVAENGKLIVGTISVCYEFIFKPFCQGFWNFHWWIIALNNLNGHNVKLYAKCKTRAG